MIFLFFPTGPLVEPPQTSIIVVSGNWAENQLAPSSDWSNGLSVSGGDWDEEKTA